MEKYVSYERCSTQYQANSNLGLKYQKYVISNFVNYNGGELVHSFVEVRSGSDKKGIRPILKEAIEYCKQNNFTLIGSTLDRLCRSHISFDFLCRSGIKFITVDNPTGNHIIFKTILEFSIKEIKVISERTKNGLSIKRDELKRVGKFLGNPNLDKVRHLAHKARRESIISDDLRNDKTYVVMEIYKDYEGQQGSYKNCSDKLNELNIIQPNGRSFTQQQVRRYVIRYKKLQKIHNN